MDCSHQLKVRIYYEDTDAGGIVYYANYLKFLERGRTEWLRELGIEQDTLLNTGIAFVVRRVEMDNHSPAKFNQLITVHSTISQVKKASLMFEQKVLNDDGKTLVTAQVKIACVKIASMKPAAIPAAILKELNCVI